MQISANTTGMTAGLNVALDKNGRESCVVVVKGTFRIDPQMRTALAEEQEPMVCADIHRGDPATTSILYECDFAPFKPRAEVLVNGHAYSPGGYPADEVMVLLQVGPVRKEVRVSGDRYWVQGISGWRPSRPKPFVTMSLVFERAYGGVDDTHSSVHRRGAELRNLVGVGFHLNSGREAVEGRPVPNLEDPAAPICGLSDRPHPMGLAVVGRGWQPRISYAGTYDERWRNERLPFLPEDFDPRYFLSAQEDQQLPYFKGGEVVRCANMTQSGAIGLSVPRVEVPILFRFRDRDVEVQPVLDTLILEPDEPRVIALWRTAIPLGRKIHALREVFVGRVVGEPVRRLDGKLRFRSLGEFVAWKRREREKDQEV